MNFLEFDEEEEKLRKEMFKAYYGILLDKLMFFKARKIPMYMINVKEIEDYYKRLKWFGIPCEEIDTLMNEFIVKVISEA